ncbi:transposase [Vibrio neonatus]|uniref:transposase n=1 Tax=Vibrio neonatus TaxID=278860 RepID=UPI0039EEA71F
MSVCPHCDSADFTKYGTTGCGQQRYKCKSCERTFNSLAGTPLARMRRQDKWHQYSEEMWLTTKIRQVA